MTEYVFPSVEQVLYIHSRLIGSHRKLQAKNVRDYVALSTVLEAPKVSWLGKDLYPGLTDKAAVLWLVMVKERPFVIANTQATYALVKRFLFINGRELFAPQKEILRICFAVEGGKARRWQITEWLKKYSRQRGARNALLSGPELV